MAQPDLEESNRALSDSYARNPVVPSKPEPVIQQAANAVSPEFGGAPTGETFAGAPTAPIRTGSVDYGNEFRGEAAPVAAPPATTSSSTPVITDAALAPRTTYGNEGRGNGQANVIGDSVAGAPGITRIGNSYSGSGANPNQPVAPYDREATQAQLDQLNRRAELRAAGNEQDRRAGVQNSLATTDRLQAGQDLLRAESEARVATFRANNGADVILGSSRDKRAARTQLGIAAADANAKVGELRGPARAPYNPAGDVFKTALDANEAARRGGLLDSQANQNVIGAAIDKQKLEQQQRINMAGQSLLSETNPQKRAEMQKNLLTLMGKDPRKNYEVKTVKQPGQVDPLTGAVIPGEEVLAIIPDDGGRPEFIRPPAAAGAAKNPVEEAKAAVAQGADRAKVNARLKAMGLPPV